MTIAPGGAFVKAAHEPSPANGLSGMPSTFTGTSFRAQAIRTTPSSVVVALVAAAVPILSASSREWYCPRAGPDGARVMVASRKATARFFIIRLMEPLLRWRVTARFPQAHVAIGLQPI